METSMNTIVRFVAALVLSLGVYACTPAPTEGCRFDPNGCGGNVGAFCSTNNECAHGDCCTAAANCAGGMCTLPCKVNADCPSFMGCAHDICFFSCTTSADCAVGQGCQHITNGVGVCEWP